MEIWDADKLLLFIAFVIPGFVALKSYDLLFASTQKESGRQLVDAVAYSCINYALLFWPILVIERSGLRHSHPIAYATFYASVVLVAPIIWTSIFAGLRRTQLLQGFLPHPVGKPWDYVFGQRKPYWVIVTLKDGKQIAGRYDSLSFASSSPQPEQLYLQETWVLNEQGGFERPRNSTAGILLLAADILTVELFELTFGENHESE